MLGQLSVRNKMDGLLTVFALFLHRPESIPEPVYGNLMIDAAADSYNG